MAPVSCGGDAEGAGLGDRLAKEIDQRRQNTCVPDAYVSQEIITPRTDRMTKAIERRQHNRLRSSRHSSMVGVGDPAHLRSTKSAAASSARRVRRSAPMAVSAQSTPGSRDTRASARRSGRCCRSRRARACRREASQAARASIPSGGSAWAQRLRAWCARRALWRDARPTAGRFQHCLLPQLLRDR